MKLVIRTITLEWMISCYSEDNPSDSKDKCLAYKSDWFESPIEETGYFPDLSLVRWGDKMRDAFEELIKDQGEKDCQDIKGYLHLCKYEIIVKSVEEIEIPVVPVIPVAPVVPVAPVECPEADIALYKEIQKRLVGYKKQIVKLEAKRDALRQKESRTNTEVIELRKTINNLEHYLQMESKDIDQLARLKEKCPNIEELIK